MESRSAGILCSAQCNMKGALLVLFLGVHVSGISRMIRSGENEVTV